MVVIRDVATRVVIAAYALVAEALGPIRLGLGPPVDLSLSHRTDGDKVIVNASGELDIYTMGRLRDLLIDIASNWKEAYPFTITFDLTLVEFLDSAALGVLVGGVKRIILLFGRQYEDSQIPPEERKGPILNPQGKPIATIICYEHIAKIIRMTNLTKVFEVFNLSG